MSSDEIREKYLNFFVSRGHARIDPSPLVLEDDPTTLFTSAGMQPLVSFLKGEPHPKGKRLVDVQPSFRTVDIDEIGDNRHLTFFEMLGNWSLGDYFKVEQLAWCLEFFTKELGLDQDKLWISVFEGSKEVPKDEESIEIWKNLGIPESRIFYYGAKENWWSRSGPPESMPSGEIGGPDSEVFFEFDIPHNPKFGKDCHPNCQCGRFIEIGNSVFIQYQKNEDSTLSELPQKNVDFGGGLERITAAANNTPDIFETDLFWPLIKKIQTISSKEYKGNERPMRIIADHIRASVMVMAEGVFPSNKLQGDVLRSLISRATEQKVTVLGVNNRVLKEIAIEMVNVYKAVSPQILENKDQILSTLDQEELRYHHKIEKGLPKFEAELKKVKLETKDDAKFLIGQNVKPFGISSEEFLKKIGDSFSSLPSIAAGTATFYGTSTHGLPLYTMTPIIQENWAKANIIGEIEKADKLMHELHREESRKQSAGRFKGGLADTSEQVVRLHTATHLLHAALRKILGGHVSQKGSNITAERLRFDFSHPQKLTETEIKKVEKLVNEAVEKNLSVSFEEKSLDEALAEGALAFFGERYAGKVKVYTVGDFSKEVCGGPHVTRTSEVGRVRIVKQEKLGTGVVRIYATAG